MKFVWAMMVAIVGVLLVNAFEVDRKIKSLDARLENIENAN
jgi:hypothetical protein